MYWAAVPVGGGDGFSRRTKIVEKLSVAVQSTKQFVWVGGTIAEERDGSNGVQKKFFGLGEWRNGVGNLYYARDHLGNLRELTDNSSVVRARYEYDPYGRRSANLITGGNALAADWGFTGHYYHAPSTLHLAWFRAYDANLGRWISRDPIGERGGLNLYGYASNDPMNWIDPDGKSIIFAGLVLILVVSAGIALWSLDNGSEGTSSGRTSRDLYHDQMSDPEDLRTPSLTMGGDGLNACLASTKEDVKDVVSNMPHTLLGGGPMEGGAANRAEEIATGIGTVLYEGSAKLNEVLSQNPVPTNAPPESKK